MSGVTWDTFERYKQKGLDARRAGQWDSARIYLLEAARAMTELARHAQGAELQEARRQMAQRLLDLARDCQRAREENRRAPTPVRKRGGGAPTDEEAAESEGSRTGSRWLVREKPHIRFDDVAGLDEVKENIRLKMVYPVAHPDLAEKYKIKVGGGILLYGPPGTGKTMLARATAGEIDAAFFAISPADILSKWVGEAEQNIKKVFEEARSEKRAVIFIDEIEALLPARQDEGSSVMQRVVPQILQEMEGFEKRASDALMFMGATNVPWQLDPAVLRPGRFDEKVYVPLPDLPARLKMLEMYLRNRPLEDGIDLEALAVRLDGYSGADIKYICDRAATIPFLRSVATGKESVITRQILEEVICDTPPSVMPQMIQRFKEWAEQGGLRT